MTSTEAKQTSPPAGYIFDQWTEDSGDFFFVPEQLRHWYSSPEAGPQPRHIKRVYDAAGLGTDTDKVPVVVMEKGAYVLAAPIMDERLRRGSLTGDGLRQPQTLVDPGDPTGLAFKVWEHGIRLAWSQAAEQAGQQAQQQHYRDLLQACLVCGNAHAGGHLCAHCKEAVKAEQARRHTERFQAEIAAYVDEQPTWEPRPPQLRTVTGSHRI
jgi:hypothetical protein